MGHRVAVAALVVLAGCGGDPAPAPRNTPAPAARGTASATPAPPAKPPHRIVRFRASDRRRLHGELTPAKHGHAPAVVLAHGLYGEPSQWDDFVGHLHRAGFATLAYASRSDHEPDEAVLARDLTGPVGALRARQGRNDLRRRDDRPRRRADWPTRACAPARSRGSSG